MQSLSKFVAVAGAASRRKATELIRAGRVRNIYQEVILRHAASIRAGRPMTGEDGLHNLRLVAAAHRSAAAGGRPIPVT